jgi:hypothetical protein
LKKFLILASISILLFFSCSVNVGLVFDDFVPVEQSTEIWFYRVGTVTGYNGISVKWEPGMLKSVQIPAGDTLLEFSVFGVHGNTNYVGEGVLFRYNFQPQKMYCLIFTPHDREGANIYGVNVYTYNIGEKMNGKNLGAHFTAFVPFLNEK